MIELEAARTQLEPLHAKLVEAYLAAWGNWRRFLEESSDLAVPLTTTGRANFVHAHVCSEVERRIGGAGGVASTEALDFYALRVGADILLRFKFTQRGLPSNVKTKRQGRLGRQIYTRDEVLALTGGEALVAPTLLTAGYTIDRDEVGRIEIRRDCKGHPPWAYDIYGGAAVVEPIPLDGMQDTMKPAIIVSALKREEEGDAVAELG